MAEECIRGKHPIGGAIDIATYVSGSRNVGLVTTAFSVQNAEVDEDDSWHGIQTTAETQH